MPEKKRTKRRCVLLRRVWEFVPVGVMRCGVSLFDSDFELVSDVVAVAPFAEPGMSMSSGEAEDVDAADLGARAGSVSGKLVHKYTVSVTINSKENPAAVANGLLLTLV